MKTYPTIFWVEAKYQGSVNNGTWILGLHLRWCQKEKFCRKNMCETFIETLPSTKILKSFVDNEKG